MLKLNNICTSLYSMVLDNHGCLTYILQRASLLLAQSSDNVYQTLCELLQPLTLAND